MFTDTLYYHFQSKKVGVNDLDFRQKSKNLIFDHIFEKFWMIQIFFEKSGSVTLCPLLSFNFMPSFGKILWSVFEKNSEQTDTQTHTQGSIYRTNLQSRWVQKSNPTWPGPASTNLAETKTFQFCKNLVQKFCTNVSLRNRGKVFAYKKYEI